MIGVCGFGYTGSGAVLDYLKQFKNLKVCDDFEFPITYRPDGLLNLERALLHFPNRFLSSDYAITRFKFLITYFFNENLQSKNIKKACFDLLDSFINEIAQVKWESPIISHKAANVYGDFQTPNDIKLRLFLQKTLRKLKLRKFDVRKKEMRYFSIRPEKFLESSQVFISKLLEVICPLDEGEIRVLDQPFSADNVKESFVFFENPKVIIVDRDPRDLYLYAKEIKGGIHSIPTNTVENFVAYYKAIRNNYDLSGPYDQSKTLLIRFEDLIYKNAKTSQIINDFLGLNPHHKVRKSEFIPVQSKINTNLAVRFPEFEKDIKFIEKELAEWLYDFGNS